MMLKRTLIVVTLMLLSLGCGSDPTSPANGTVSLFLTDAPIDLSNVSAVEVTLDKPPVLFGNAGMVEDDKGMEMELPGVSPGEPLTLNLLDFQDGNMMRVAILDVPAGQYQKVRLYIGEATLVEIDPQDEMLEIRHPIDVPSSKVDILVSFTVTGGKNTEVLLDFDAERSVQVNETQGNKEYILRPVITPVGMSGG
jgi:hypothetical protein